MKKFFRLSGMFAILLCFCTLFTACKPKLEGISVDKTTIQTEYYVGQTVDTYENAKVYASFDDGTKSLIDNDDENLSFSTISTAEIGTQVLTITYKEKTTTVNITIREKEVTAIANVTGIKTVYTVGETVDTYANAVVSATFEDGSTANVDLTYVTFSEISTEEEGTQTLTITYSKGDVTVSTTKTIYINEKEIDRIGQLTGVGNVETSEDIEPIEMYDQDEISDEKIKNDILYAIDCLIIIFAVKNYMAPTIEDAVKFVLS